MSNTTNTAFTAYTLGNTTLANRLVMAPMTRSRAINNVPTALMATYYAQRAGAGLIITEGVSPSPNGLGYARIPGLFSNDQVNAWKPVTDAVHQAGGKIFAQLMHTGRIGHPLNLPEGARIVAPSAVIAIGKMWTDKEGMKDHTIPQALSAEQLVETKNEYVQAARHAVEAGFDGIELHSANGYLLEQFLSPYSNKRTDIYGGSFENRSRFVLEVAREVSEAIGKDKVGIRLSPFGVFNEMPHYPEIEAAYTYLAEELNKIGIVYLHLVDHSSGGAPEVPLSIKKTIREKFKNTLILSGGYTLARAEEDLSTGFADLVAFGKAFITNPDLVERLQKGLPLNSKLDPNSLYSPDAKGYTDYPVFADESIIA
ncbi:MAG TPA: alkene reductase [Cyclobacteriaceae bacterium]|nr:alkene reductase [Cyclobacteriaceae bacterium]